MGADEHSIYTGSNSFSLYVDHYGDARGTKSEFENSDPSAIDPLINANINAYHLATETLGPKLTSIRAALEACWTGNSADNALNILTQLSANASTIGANTKACHDSLATFQSQWISLKSQASDLYEGVAGTGVHEDNAGAHRIYKNFNDAMQTSMHSMPSQLVYRTPFDSSQVGGPGPGPGGPGPGFPGPGPGHPGPGFPGPGFPGPGGPGFPGPGFPGPGFPGPGFPGPGFPGPGSPGPGNYPGGNGGYGPGSGLDTGSQLASYTGGGMGPGPGPGLGLGPGPGYPGPGYPGPGVGLAGAAGLAGSETEMAAISSRAGIAGVGAGQSGTGERGMMGRGSGGGGDDEDERDRTTWLSEEEGIWDGEPGAPPGTIA